MNWVKKASAETKMSETTEEIKEIEFDEMWHFIGAKKKKMDIQSCGSQNKKNYCLGYR